MSARFIVGTTPLPGVMVIERSRIGDDRGFLERLFCADELRAAGWTWPIAQINRTLTRARGTIRGMHFQRSPAVEAKLISCLRGSVFDVAVDLRAGSRSFGVVHTQDLSADNRRALLIPPGCAHGFQALEDDVELVYLHSAAYTPACEGGISPYDPTLGIAWPIADARLSDRDAAHPVLDNQFQGIAV